MTNQRYFQRIQTIAAWLGALGVITGAFGAHYLKSRLEDHSLETIKTGVLYLFVHVMAALVVSVIGRQQESSPWLRRAALAFIAGIFMFSGSLFIIATAPLTGFPVAFIGPVTPLGGLSFILGWIFLAVGSTR